MKKLVRGLADNPDGSQRVTEQIETTKLARRQGRMDELRELVDEEEEDDDEAVVECPRCDELNEPDAAFCYRCGFALDIDAAEEVEEVEEKTAETAEPDELEVAQKLVKAMQDKPELVDEILEEES
jgi:hypothetical protein